MFLFNPPCPCCKKRDTPDISPGGGGWECGRCTSVPIRYKLTVPDTSGASLTVTVPVVVDDALGRPVTVPFNVEVANVASYGGEHTLRRARSNTESVSATVPKPYQIPPYIDDNGYFVFPYDRPTDVPGSSRGNQIYRDIRPCDWFGNYTNHDFSGELTIGGQVYDVDALLPGVDHFWRMRMNSTYVRIEGPSSLDYPDYYEGIVGVRYQVSAANFNCNSTTVLPYAANNPRASGWPETVTIEAIIDE